MSNRRNRFWGITAAALAAWLAAGVASAQTPTPVQGGDCCAIHNGVGCDDQLCEDCVAEIDPPCAILPWDQFCVADATDPACADLCACNQTPTPTPTPGGDCCSAHDGTGCDVASCQTCVCNIDAPCCNMVWDATCVAEASNECLSQCPCVAPPTETPAPTPTPGGDCCAAHGGPSCDDNACQACVCALDDECCSGVWDAECASEASIECALECACPGAEPCCAAHDSVSCSDVRCKTCVCDLDAACCTDLWDQTCVDEATVDCQIDCPCDAAGSCCEPHDGIGCDVQSCQDCVCALDAPCCTDAWDARCADEAATDCANRCSACAGANCCEAHNDAGCGDDVCQACVCSVDGFCCNELWDAGCVSIAEGDCPDECNCAPPPSCAGDCNGDGTVTVNELITAVNIALGNAPVSTCPAVDTNGDGTVTVNELIQAVNSALNGCA
jgi:hypothetical protein